jgi:hypothetical protein
LDLPFPKIPSLLGPIIILIIGAISLIGGKKMVTGALIVIAIGGIWFYFKNKKRAKNAEIVTQSRNRREDLITQATGLIS